MRIRREAKSIKQQEKGIEDTDKTLQPVAPAASPAEEGAAVKIRCRVSSMLLCLSLWGLLKLVGCL